MQWFGPIWEGGVCKECPECKIPEPSQVCHWCSEGFVEGDRGVRLACGSPYHLECLMRSLNGSAVHVLRMCECYRGVAIEESTKLSIRENARLAMEVVMLRNRVLASL